MDERADLLGRYEERARRLSKKKKNRKPGRPASAGGGQSGCGTGKGGFGLGNNCAKEDGRPDMPKSFAQGGKSATAASLPATKEALVAKAAYLKKKAGEAKASEKAGSISLARKEAAIRKKEKQEREAADKKAAEEAYAKKRAELLQKIRIKKANERLQVDGKDFGLAKAEGATGRFSGKADDSLKKQTGETEFEFQSRRVQKDLESFHKRADDIDATSKPAEEKLRSDWRAIDEAYSKQYEAENSANKGPYALIATIDGKQIDGRSETLKALDEQRKVARRKLNDHIRETKRKHHDLVAEFTAAHGGGASQIPTDLASHNIATKKYRSGDQSWLTGVWAFLGKVASKKHTKAIMSQKLTISSSGGGTHQSNTQTLKTSTSGSTAVHEYGHAIESYSNGTLKALEEDYNKRLQQFFAANPNSGLVRHGAVSYYEGPELATADGKRPKRRGARSAKSLLGYVSRYSDFGYDSATIAKYKSPRFARGTEVFSTGLEALFDNPSGFRAAESRQHYNLTLLILAGRL